MYNNQGSTVLLPSPTLMCGSKITDSYHPNAYKLPSEERKQGESDSLATHLGFTKCLMVPAMANATKRDDVATYAHPRNGFLPPIHETVEMTIDLVPEYGRTG